MSVRAAVILLTIAGSSVSVNLLVAGTQLVYPWWVVAPGAAVAAVAIGVRRHRPGRRMPWAVLLGALVLLWVGWSMSAWIGAGLGDQLQHGTIGVIRDILYLVAYPLLGAASLLMVRARTGGRDRDNVIDSLIVMVALATVLAACLFSKGEFASAVSDHDRLWVGLSPLLLAAVVAGSVRVLFAAGRHLPAAWLLVVSSLLTLLGNLWATQLVRDGSPTQVTGIDILWVLGFVAVGAAALHPSMRQITEPLPADQLVDGMPVDRIGVLSGALVAAPLSHLRMAGSDTPETAAVVAGGVIVACLVMWRVARLLRERDAIRRRLANVAARNAIVATVGGWALDDRSTALLLADVDELVRDALPGAVCAVVPTVHGAPNVGPVSGTADGRASPGLTDSFAVEDGHGRIATITVSFAADGPELRGQRNFLETLAVVLSAAARRRSAEAQLRHDALHDPLTGLPNRTLAMDRLEHLLSRRDIGDVTVVFLDLDGFKAINDTLGHEAGDRVLRDLADRMSAAVRDGDTVARLAGDEFVVLVGHADPLPLQALVDRLRDAATVQLHAGSEFLEVTASIGLASGHPGVVDAESLLRRADEAMFRVKKQGGHHAIWADGPLEQASTVTPVV